ncbi:Gfo/Idh/MocA family protein [Nonomuraea sp. NPDC051191]|uniref:Gfo/Idh/MocA family protein n=1 Tax=Nonomuraea sp. NPDC051191 TaxID=3364372 RepID=UPI0037AA828A
MRQVGPALVGAGDRGTRYTRYATADGRARLTTVAEPDPRRREGLLAQHPDAGGFGDWRELAEQPRLADAVVIATLDAGHVEPTVRFAELGYHILLEKPMAIRLEDCRRIVAAAERAGVLFAVCHDVVDHQVVGLEFDGGATTSFTMTAFSPILSAPRESLHSHEIAWAAEEARLTGTVVTLKERRRKPGGTRTPRTARPLGRDRQAVAAAFKGHDGRPGCDVTVGAPA